MPVIIKQKTPLLLFSRSLVYLKNIQHIQKDLEKIDTPKKEYKFDYIYQSYLVHLVALWEVFIEKELEYGYRIMVSTIPLGATEPIFEAYMKGLIKNLHSPNKEKIDELFKVILGIDTISNYWFWDGMTAKDSQKYIKLIIETRNQIAHESRTKNTLSYEKNFLYMKHLFNLATIIEFEVERHLCSFSNQEFTDKLELPYPEINKTVLE